jgi:uncharacterized protein (DUF488 family)
VQPVRTLGHGSLAPDDFARVALAGGIEVVVDVRRFPGSRRHPHFGREQMAGWLSAHGLDYRWLPSLGGRRKPTPNSRSVGLRNEQFRGYADHMASPEFSEGVAELLALTASRPAAVMCAESMWWHCHRRLLADHLLLVEQVPVEHLFHDGRAVTHVPSPEARLANGLVVYDVGERPLPLGPPDQPRTSAG